ncbi:hypothetical protein FRC00_011558, partial [Tulasnella sp. 408]
MVCQGSHRGYCAAITGYCIVNETGLADRRSPDLKDGFWAAQEGHGTAKGRGEGDGYNSAAIAGSRQTGVSNITSLKSMSEEAHEARLTGSDF